MFKKFKNNKAVYLIIFLLLLLGVGIAVREGQKSQENRSRAEGETVNLFFIPETQLVDPNTELTTHIKINTNDLAVTGYDITLQLDPTTAEYVSFTPTDAFNSQLINILDPNDNTVRFSAVDTSSTEKKGEIELGYLKLKAKDSGSGQVTISKSQITASGFDTAIPANISSSSYTISTESGPTATLTPDPNPDPEVGEIRGKYVDSSGNLKVIPGQSVTILNQTTGDTQTKTVSPEWTFTNLPAGDYTVTASPIDKYSLEHKVCFGCMNEDEFHAGGTFSVVVNSTRFIGTTFKYTSTEPAPNPDDGRGGGDNTSGGNNNNTTIKTGDLNKDGKVNILDLSILLKNWNKSGLGDLTNDNKVNLFDLSVLLRNWNK